MAFARGAPALCVKLWLFFTTFAPVAYVGYIFQQGTFTSNPKHKRIATYYWSRSGAQCGNFKGYSAASKW